jgi:hypothetical protein
MLGRVNTSIQQLSASVSPDLAARDGAVSRLESLKSERRRLDGRASEATTIAARLSLLDAQYEADMERLSLVKSAGTLLGYFDAEECVFCGASAEHQRCNHAVYETAQLTEAIDTEAAHTRFAGGSRIHCGGEPPAAAMRGGIHGCLMQTIP